MSFTVGSLFDGSGGFPLAAFMCGGVPVWASEIEPYPIAVTKTRFPYMKHLGSVTDIKGNEVEPVDVITFGSPCQDLSIAGKRAGLKHEDNGDEETTRSGLFMEAVRIIKEMREATGGKYPRIALWENVPGAFSSNKGEDFRVVCEELIKIVEPTAVMPAVPKSGWAYADHYCGEGWSLAYRTLDSQFWGVPQRRKRIYLVLDLGGQCAGEVSFEREGLRGYFEEGRAPWKAVAADAERGSGTADCERNCVVFTQNQREEVRDLNGVCGALSAEGGMHQQNYVCEPVAYSFDALSSNSMKSSNPHSGCRQVEIAKTLDCFDPNPSKNQGGIAIVEPIPYLLKIRSGCEGGDKGALIQEDKSATISTLNDQYLFQPVVVDTHILDDQGGSQISVRDDGKCPTLRAEMHGNVPCVMDAVGFDMYNQQSTGDVSRTLKTPAGGDDLPVACIKEALPFDTTQVTSPMNYSNPKWGDPCHPLAAGAHPPAVVCKCWDARGNGDGSTAATITGDHENRVTDYTSSVCEPTVCLEGNGNRPSHRGDGYIESDVMYTLNTIERHGVAYGIDNEKAVCYRQGGFADYVEGEVGTLRASGGDFGGGSENSIRIQYIVRRLTPTECARLQGFPDGWGHPDQKDSFTDEEYEFWLNVRNTHAEINGKTVKSYTEDQMLNWYNKLHTDSAEYKLWGNGIALPTALYMMQGIAEVFK